MQWSWAETVPTGDQVSCHQRTKTPPEPLVHFVHSVSHPGSPENSLIRISESAPLRLKLRDNGCHSHTACSPPKRRPLPQGLQGHFTSIRTIGSGPKSPVCWSRIRRAPEANGGPGCTGLWLLLCQRVAMNKMGPIGSLERPDSGLRRSEFAVVSF